MNGNGSNKLRAVFLAFVMVTSVMVASVAFTGSAAAADGDVTDGPHLSDVDVASSQSLGANFDTVPGQSIGQGEIAIQFQLEESGGTTDVRISTADGNLPTNVDDDDVVIESISTSGDFTIANSQKVSSSQASTGGVNNFASADVDEDDVVFQVNDPSGSTPNTQEVAVVLSYDNLKTGFNTETLNFDSAGSGAGSNALDTKAGGTLNEDIDIGDYKVINNGFEASELPRYENPGQVSPTDIGDGLTSTPQDINNINILLSQDEPNDLTFDVGTSAAETSGMDFSSLGTSDFSSPTTDYSVTGDADHSGSAFQLDVNVQEAGAPTASFDIDIAGNIDTTGVAGPVDTRYALQTADDVSVGPTDDSQRFTIGGEASPNVVNSGTPDSIAAGEDEESQDLAGQADIEFFIPNNAQSVIKIETGELGADLSNAEVSASATTGTVDGTSVVDDEVRLVVTPSGETVRFTSGDLNLNKIDTSSINTKTNLQYTIRLDADNAGEFDQFTTDSFSQSGEFDVGQVEVENLDQTGDSATITETSLTEAIDEANSPDDLAGSSSDEIVIRPSEGTFTLDTSDIPQGAITGSDTTIEPLTSGANVTLVNANDDDEETLQIDGASNVEIKGVTFDGDTAGHEAIELEDGSSESLTLTDVTFENNHGAEYIDAEDGADLTVEDSTFGDVDADTDGIVLANDGTGGALTADNNEFDNLETALDISGTNTGVDVDTVDVSNNVFANNSVHVDDGGDEDDANIDSIFGENDNEFDQFVISTDDTDNEIRDGDEMIAGNLNGLLTDGPSLDTGDTTTIISAGDHSIGTGPNEIVDLSDTDNVDIVGEHETSLVQSTDVTTEDVTVDISGASNSALKVTDAGTTTGLRVAGITFDLSDTAVSALEDPDGGELEELTVENNRFVDIPDTPGDGDEAVIDLKGGTTDLQSGSISDNSFNATTAAGSEYDGILIEQIDEDATDAEISINDNTVLGARDGIEIQEVDDDDAGSVTLLIQNNDIELLDGSDTPVAIDIQDAALANDDNQPVEVSITGNTLLAESDDAERNANGIDGIGDAAAGSDLTITIEENDIDGFATGLDLTNIDGLPTDNSELSVDDNDFGANTRHINSVGTETDGDDLVDNNQFDILAQVLDADGGTITDGGSNAVHGSIGAASSDAGDGDFISVAPGTYNETLVGTVTIDQDDGDLTIESTEGADSTSIVNTADQDTILVDDSTDFVLDGFSISSSTDTAKQDIDVNPGTSSDELTLKNLVLAGPEDNNNRDAIQHQDGDLTVEDIEVSGYSRGLVVDADTISLDGYQMSDVDDGVVVNSDVGNNGVSLVNGTVVAGSTAVDITRGIDEMTMTNNTFEAEDIAAVNFDGADDDDIEDVLLNESTIRATNGDGIIVNDGEIEDIAIEDNTLTAADAAVSLQNDNANNNQDSIDIVRNDIVDSTTGVLVDGTEEANVNFNDITGNDVAIEDNEGSDLTAVANYYGDGGPSGEANNDEFFGTGGEIDADSGGDTFVPYLTQPVDELPRDEYIVVTDPRNVFTDGNAGTAYFDTDEAHMLVAVLDDSAASEISGTSDTSFLSDPGGVSLSFDDEATIDSDADVSAANPLLEDDFLNDEQETFNITATYSGSGDAPAGDGTGVQPVIDSADGVTLEAESTTVVADGDTQTNLTAQVTSSGEPVGESGVDVSFDLRNGGNEADASIEVLDANTQTDGTGQVDIAVTAEDNTGTFDVRAIALGTASSVTLETTAAAAPEFQVNVTDAPDTIIKGDSYNVTANVTNVGSAAGSATVNYDLEDSTSIARIEQSQDVTSVDVGASQQVTFNVTGSDTSGLSTGSFTHVFSTSDDEATQAASVVEEGAEPADFEVSDVSPDGANVTAGDDITVEATVENVGGQPATQDVEFRLDTDQNGTLEADEELATESVQLDSGSSDTVTFENVSTDGLNASTFTHGVVSENDTATATITVEEAQQQEPSVSVTFNDQSVQSGTEEVTVASANFTRADGSAGDYVVVVHVVSDEFDGGLDNSISAPVGASGNLSNGAESITVDLNSSAAFEDGDALDTLSENVTLRAMLHTTANDSAFGTRLGNAIDGIEPGDETDDADITVTPASPLDGPAGEFDENADGEIDIGELGQAGQAFAQGDLTITELGEVGQAFAS